MTLETSLLIGAALIGISSLALSILSLFRSRRQQAELNHGADQIECLEGELAEARQMLEESKDSVLMHSRRIAWLDAKVRQNRFVSGSKPGSDKPKSRNRSKIRENKDRVLELANRGQDANRIASSLGMMPGEVELILNLNNHVNVIA